MRLNRDNKPITEQVRSPILTRHAKQETRSASAGRFDVGHPVTPAAAPQVAGPSQTPTAQSYSPAQVQQLVIQAALNPEEQIDEEKDEVFTDTEDMTEDKTIGPGIFSGTTG